MIRDTGYLLISPDQKDQSLSRPFIRALTPIFNRGLSLIFLFFLASAVRAENCRVIDPELQGSYSGPCVNGLAEGVGSASGTASYHGGFKAGLKDGHGVKSWPNGDRYEGGFVNDRKEGQGVYTWGRGKWEGERYEGGYVADRRQGYGVYRWPTGDVYSGPWDKDAMTGPSTPMMLAHQKFLQEARAAVAKEGQKVCRAVRVGIARRDWVRGTVVAVEAGKERVGVRIDEPGKFPGGEARAGEVVWDVTEAWTPCL